MGDGFRLNRKDLVDLVRSMSDDESLSFLSDAFRSLLAKYYSDGVYSFDSFSGRGSSSGAHLVFHDFGRYLVDYVGFNGREEYFSELEQKVGLIGFYTGALSREFSFSGLLREDFSWLFSASTDLVDGRVVRSVVPARYIKDFPSVNDCSPHELLVLYLDYKDGVISGLTRDFDYESSLRRFVDK